MWCRKITSNLLLCISILISLFKIFFSAMSSNTKKKDHQTEDELPPKSRNRSSSATESSKPNGTARRNTNTCASKPIPLNQGKLNACFPLQTTIITTITIAVIIITVINVIVTVIGFGLVVLVLCFMLLPLSLLLFFVLIVLLFVFAQQTRNDAHASADDIFFFTLRF